MQCKKNFDKFFDKSVINPIGKSSGFVLRKAQKISAYHFVLGFLLCCGKRHNTFGEWALQIGRLTGKNVSKQAIFERLYRGATVFAEQLLKHIIIEQSHVGTSTNSLFSAFGKVVLQDSTTLRLPKILASVFRGNTADGEQKSQVRIQTIINVKAMQFLHFALTGFTHNDQSASGQVISHVKKGDLVIRDLGYFVTDTFEKLIKRQIHFLSRLKYGMILYKPNGEKIKLTALLRQNRIIDQETFIGKRKLPVRLVMIPLPVAQAAERIRKARCDRDRRTNHSKEYYQWLRYGVFITTVDKDTWKATQVAEAYKIRWQIEIIFKSWKSGAGMQSMLHKEILDEQRVRTSIYLFLIFICLFIKKIFVPLSSNIERRTGRSVSLLKLTKLICDNMWYMFAVGNKKLMEVITRHSCYDQRHDRLNMTDLFNKFKN